MAAGWKWRIVFVYCGGGPKGSFSRSSRSPGRTDGYAVLRSYPSAFGAPDITEAYMPNARIPKDKEKLVFLATLPKFRSPYASDQVVYKRSDRLSAAICSLNHGFLATPP